MTGRYVFCPMTAKRIGRRVTLADRFRRWRGNRRARKNGPDLFPTVGYYPPVYPGK